MDKIRIRLDDAEQGMVIAHDIYNDKNQLIVVEGTILNEKVIGRLIMHDVHSVLIFRGGLEDNTAPIMVSYLDSLKNTDDFASFEHTYNVGINQISNNLAAILQGGQDINVPQLVDNVNVIMQSCGSSIRLLELLQCIREYDDLTFVHSFNVAIICGIFGGWMHYSKDDIQTVILCGLLHDIGKMKIPQEIILKSSRLTDQEYQMVKKHPQLGYELVRDTKIDDRVKNAILTHHERIDGSGYPFGLTGSRIHEFSQMVAIADVYDAMTADRCYRKAVCPFDVVGTFEGGGLGKYDTKLLLIFLENIIDSYVNYTVRLSDNRVGDVIMINKRALSKPLVRVKDEFIDLSKEKSLKILEVI